MSKNTRNRILLTAVAALLLVVVAVGGTVAYLTAESTVVSNTFTYSGITIDLWEHPLKGDKQTIDVDGEKTDSIEDYLMVPGVYLEKDPTVTVKANSQACYVFIKMEKSDNFDTFMELQAINTEWKAVPNNEGWYYYTKEVPASTVDQDTAPLLGDPAIKVKDTVKIAELSALTADTYPSLDFTAYAIQSRYLGDTDTDLVLNDTTAAQILQYLQRDLPTT